MNWSKCGQGLHKQWGKSLSGKEVSDVQSEGEKGENNCASAHNSTFLKTGSYLGVTFAFY